MNNRKPNPSFSATARPPAPAYASSPAGMIAGRAYLDEADMVAADMDRKWGFDRLRLLVSPELRIKFDRQRYLLNRAVWHGELADVQREAQRMMSAWRAADREAEASGAGKLQIEVWEVALENGSIAAIVRPNGRYARVEGDTRDVSVYTLEEIGHLLSSFPEIVKAKEHFRGATVVSVKPSQADPLDSLRDTSVPIDTEDEIPF